MKLNPTLHLKTASLAIAAMAFAYGSAQAVTVVTLDFTTGGQGELSTDETFTTTDTGSNQLGSAQGGVDLAPGNVTFTDAGFTGTYSISLDVENVGLNGVAAVGIERGGSGTLGTLTGDVLMDPDQSLVVDNLVLTFVSGDDVFQFDGFVGGFTGNQGNRQGVEVSTYDDALGNNLLTVNTGDPGHGPGANSTPSVGLPNNFNGISQTVVFEGVGTTLNSVTGQFSAIPEPSSAALLGLTGLALLRRRRG